MEPADVRGLLALLLADGSLVPYRSPGGGYVQLTLTAGLNESAFLEEKVAEFRHFIPTDAQIAHYTTTPRANGKTTMVLRFRVSTNKLRPIYNLLYPGGERTITRSALDLLGGTAAAWMWAEGARRQRDNSFQLARVGTTYEEAELIGQWLTMLTGADSRIDEERVRPRLLFSAAQAAKIQEALLPYAPVSRKHLFLSEIWDERSIRSARTQLLLGKRGDPAQGADQAPVAEDPAT